MQKTLTTLLFAPILLVFSSFTTIVTENNVQPIPTYNEFIQDAYDFRIKNNHTIPTFYYEVLGIKNPIVHVINVHDTIHKQEPRLRDQIPLWIRKGQLMRESSSYYNSDGTIKYVNKSRGGNNHKNGATGPFQVLKIAWDHMRNENPEFFRGKRYTDMQTNLKLNEDVAAMYLLYIYNGKGNNNWNTTIMLYNRGPWGNINSDAREYLKKVTYYGKKNDK